MAAEDGAARVEVDLLVRGRFVVTVDAALGVVADGAVAVRGQEIVAVGPRAEIEARYAAARALGDDRAIVLPGLINAHTHVPMSLFRGLADDLPLETWLHDHIWPAEGRFLTGESVRAGAQLGAVEMVLGGTTTFCDMYFFEQDIAEAVREVGCRAVLAQGVLDFPTPQGLGVEDNLAYAREFIEHWLGDTLIVPSIAAHAPYSVSPPLFQRCADIAGEFGLTLQTHLCETRGEVEAMRAKTGRTPVAFLDSLGLLSARLLAAHCVWVDADDIARLAARRVRVAHNPRSNLKLASGIAPLPQLLAAGVAVGLGTDSVASNNRLDLFAEMGLTALLHKGTSLDPLAIPAATAVELATLGGARALGLDHITGSLSVGKRADLIVVDGAAPHLTPVYHPLSHLAYAATAADVRDVVIDGRLIVENREVRTVDRESVMASVARLAAEIAADRQGA